MLVASILLLYYLMETMFNITGYQQQQQQRPSLLGDV